MVDLPNRLLKQLAAHPDIFDVHENRPIFKHNFRTSLTIGALAAQRAFGATGAGVGVAVIDSGISTWHDDLSRGSASGTFPYGDQRVSAFVDFVNGQTLPYDDNGHGTHVAGIIAGNGYDSNGQKAGVAPNASLVSLKVLDANGLGTISNIIAALDWVVANKDTYNIRVVNLSVGASIRESYWTDPLTLAAKRAVDAGVVVVTAAGNMGKNAAGPAAVRHDHRARQRAVGADGWRVEHDGHAGARRRHDGELQLARSDLHRLRREAGPRRAGHRHGVARDAGQHVLLDQGVGASSRPDSDGVRAVSEPVRHEHGGAGRRRHRRADAGGQPVADAERRQGDPSVHGAGISRLQRAHAGRGFPEHGRRGAPRALLRDGATRATRCRRRRCGASTSSGATTCSRAACSVPTKNAFNTGVTWGVAKTDAGDNIVWGSDCAAIDCDNIVWGSSDPLDNIVWGSSADPCDNIVWGSSAPGDDDNIVWGSDCGGADCDNIVWGSTDPLDNIVWGTAAPTTTSCGAAAAR